MTESVAAQTDAVAAQQYYLTSIKEDIKLSNEIILHYNAAIERKLCDFLYFLIH